MSTHLSRISASHEEWVPLNTKQSHTISRNLPSHGRLSYNHPKGDTRKESRFVVAFLISAPIIAYILMSTATFTSLITLIHGHHFRISSTNDYFNLQDGRITFLPISGLRQSDITTLISLASTITRVLGTICTGVACWRAAYILLEKEGLSLSDINNLVSFPFLRPWPWGAYRITMSCMALLFLSAELYSPLLNGSVSWETVTRTAYDGGVLKGVSQSSDNYGWSIPSAGFSVIFQSVVLTTAAWTNRPDLYDKGHHTDLWRTIDVARDLPINSTLVNVTLPFFVVDSFEWITDPDATLDPDILNVTVSGSNLLNFTSASNPMDDYIDPGKLALIPHAPLNKTNTDPLQPTTVSGSFYVVISIGTPNKGEECENLTGPWFDGMPSGMKYHRRYFGNSPMIQAKYYYCLAFARVDLRAGVGRCTDCRITSRAILRNETEMELGEDLMTEPTFHVMPEVSVMLALANRTLLSPEVGIDRYIIDTLTQAYCGTWNALTDRNMLYSSTLETGVHISVQVSEATVDRRRVAAWLLLNICVAACCAAIVFIQMITSRRRVILDATLGAILLDATEVVDMLSKDTQEGRKRREGRDICNMSRLSSDEQKSRVRLKGGEKGGGRHVHFRLVPEGTVESPGSK
ncbi:hypothetical protein FRC19_007573 [Serendipita sp. 401]|nr:hypothetical protein FRC19_007573 [Serendipita sp. 401]KAG9058310.1 hypothetical protein FS842_010680 [Serendipita sp. 407]